MRLWESEEGRLVGAVHPDGPGWACPELHPDWRHLEEELLDWAESALPAVSGAGDSRYLRLFVWDYDAPRRRLLERRGYEKTAEAGTVRRMRFGRCALPRPALAGGYRLRTTRPDEPDYERMAVLLNRSFGRTIHSAAEYRNFTTHSPSFRHDLNLVAEAGDGSFAAHVGLTYEERNRYAIIEPVCTHPDHCRRGLASTLMLEGMHRVHALGATDAYVDTGERIPANELYDSLGFGEAYTGHTWCYEAEPSASPVA